MPDKCSQSYSIVFTVLKYFTTNLIVVLTWIIFRCNSMEHVLEYYTILLVDFNFPDQHIGGIKYVIILIGLDLMLSRNRSSIKFSNVPVINYFVIQTIIIFNLFYFFRIKQTEFIYFQF